MKSQLTRGVFRALIANRSYSPRECLRTAHRRKRELQYRYDRVQSAQISAVSFSNFFGFGLKNAPKRHPTDPGLEEMRELADAKTNSYQLPPRALVLEAFRAFFQSRCTKPRVITTNQLALATGALKYLQEEIEDGAKVEGKDKDKEALGAIDYSRALTAIASTPTHEINKSTEPFATFLFEALLQYANQQDKASNFDIIYSSSVKSYIEILTRTGFTSRARDMLKTVHTERTTWTPQLWNSVLHGFLSEGSPTEALETLKDMDSIGLDLKASTLEFVNANFAANASLEMSSALYTLAKSKSLYLTSKTLQDMIMLSLKKGDSDFGNRIVKDIKKRRSSTEVRTVEALWSTRERLPGQILESISKLRVNGGLTLSQEKEAVIALMDLYAFNEELKYLDECLKYWETHELGSSSPFLLYQTERRLDGGDISQAYDGYHRLQSEEIVPELKDKVTLLLGRLLVAACLSKDTPYDQITELLDALLKQKATLEPETVAAICRRLLLQEELQEVVDFLSARIDTYSSDERVLVQQEFLRLCMDTAIDDTKAWEIYELFRQIFPESSVETRTKIMRSFFSRKRADLASLVFGHMRQSEILERRPTSDTYAECFMGIGKGGDKAALNLVHNMLKLDMEVTPTVKVTNSLMAAYSGCGMAYRSLEYFEELLNSRTGPNPNSFALAFRACETYFGDGIAQAQMIMENLKKSDVDLTKEIYTAYIGAMAANLPVAGAHTVHEMENVLGEKPDALAVGTVYNAAPWDYQKEQVQNWAIDAYPELWEELLRVPREEDEWGNQNFCIDRSISP